MESRLIKSGMKYDENCLDTLKSLIEEKEKYEAADYRSIVRSVESLVLV